MKVSKISIILFLVVLLNTYYVYSYAEDRHHITIDSIPSFREGETKSIGATIVNNNKRCNYRSCSWQANGQSGSTGYIGHGGGTATVSFQVTAPMGPPGSFGIGISAVCYIPRSLYCWWDDEVSDSATIHYTYCGDGEKDSAENCRNCPQDVKCGSNQACSSEGECVTLGTDENCGSVGDRCSSSEECVDRVCKSKCGNGRKDAGENCATCPQDIKCGPDQACSSSGQCIQLGTTQNCGSIGDNCGSGFCADRKCVECRNSMDCVSKKTTTSKYVCSTDNRGRYEIVVEKGGKCISGRCTGTNEIKSSYLESCGDSPCFKDQCGCPEGYGTCEESWSCVKRGTILIGQPCDCDVQCDSGFCKDTKCVKIIDVTLSSTKATLKPGQETMVTLSISSNLDEDVPGSATLKIGSSTEMIDVSSTVSECSKNICKISGSLPGRGSDQITVTLKSDSEATIPISADVSYKVEGRDVQIKKSTSVKFTNGKKENGGGFASVTGGVIGIFENILDNQQTKGIAIVVAIVVAGLLIFYLIGRAHRPKKKHEKKEGKESKKEEPKLKGSVAKEIENLHSLMEKGILTEREFKKKKKRLLKKA